MQVESGMYANRHSKLTTLRYQMGRQETEKFWTQNKQGDTVKNQIRLQINR